MLVEGIHLLHCADGWAAVRPALNLTVLLSIVHAATWTVLYHDRPNHLGSCP